MARPQVSSLVRGGVRQGDPLSPLLFCLAEEILSRSISKLVNDGKLSLMTGPRNTYVPSHSLYADDVFIFCRGTRQNLLSLLNLFQKYGEASGHVINLSKSSVFTGVAISLRRRSSIAELLGFAVGKLPFIYLGTPIFKGKPRVTYLQQYADRIKIKLASWKASLLSIAGRDELVKSVIYGMMLHCFLVYSWPSSLLKKVEAWIRDFVWAGDVNQKKVVTVALHKVCAPKLEGGLGLRSLMSVNRAAALKLGWKLLHSDLQWAILLRARVFKHGCQISYHISSSIWVGLKSVLHIIKDNSIWQLGN